MSTDEELFGCFICFNILKGTLMLPCCSKYACEQCLNNWFTQEGRANCPHCRASMSMARLVECPYLDKAIAHLEKMKIGTSSGGGGSAQSTSRRNRAVEEDPDVYPIYCHDCDAVEDLEFHNCHCWEDLPLAAEAAREALLTQIDDGIESLRINFIAGRASAQMEWEQIQNGEFTAAQSPLSRLLGRLETDKHEQLGQGLQRQLARTLRLCWAACTDLTDAELMSVYESMEKALEKALEKHRNQRRKSSNDSSDEEEEDQTVFRINRRVPPMHRFRFVLQPGFGSKELANLKVGDQVKWITHPFGMLSNRLSAEIYFTVSATDISLSVNLICLEGDPNVCYTLRNDQKGENYYQKSRFIYMIEGVSDWSSIFVRPLADLLGGNSVGSSSRGRGRGGRNQQQQTRQPPPPKPIQPSDSTFDFLIGHSSIERAFEEMQRYSLTRGVPISPSDLDTDTPKCVAIKSWSIGRSPL